MIRFENVGLRYGLGPEVLRDLNFGINGHSFQFLTGPSGAGKTSLLRLMLLSLRPTRGLISMFDHDAATLSKDGRANLRRRIGIVFQDFRLLDHMSTYENVALPLRVLGKEEADYRAEVVELLQWVGLGTDGRLAADFPAGKTARRDCPRRDRAAPASACRRADRQCRPQSRPTPAATFHRAQQIRHRGRYCHARHRADGRVRRPAAGPARRTPACL